MYVYNSRPPSRSRYALRCRRSGRLQQKNGVLNERVAQANAVATRSQPPKPASLRDAGFAALCGGAGVWLLPCARVRLCGDLFFLIWLNRSSIGCTLRLRGGP